MIFGMELNLFSFGYLFSTHIRVFTYLREFLSLSVAIRRWNTSHQVAYAQTERQVQGTVVFYSLFYVDIHTRTRMHACIHICIHAYTRARVHTSYIHASHTCARAHTYTHTCARAYMYIYIYLFIYTYCILDSLYKKMKHVYYTLNEAKKFILR